MPTVAIPSSTQSSSRAWPKLCRSSASAVCPWECARTLGVCTNKNEQIAHQVLKGLGISQHFASVVGGDRLTTSKPHPQHLRATFEELGQDPDKGVFVGDSTIDQQCAQAAGIDFRAVEWAPSEVTGCRLSPFRQLAVLTGVESATSPITTLQEHP